MGNSNLNKKKLLFFLKFGALIFLLVIISKYGPKFATGKLEIAREKEAFIATINALKKRNDVCESESEEFNIIEPVIEKNPPAKTNGFSEEMTIGWVGDIPPSNTIPQFSETVLNWLNANDIMTGNLEGVISNSQESAKCKNSSTNCFSFVGNKNFADSLGIAGFDLFSLANNHIFDKGRTGIAETKSILLNENLLYSPENGDTVVKEVNGIETAFLSFGHNSWTKKITDIPAVKKSVQDAADKYPVVIVFFHGGAEGEPQTHVTKNNEYYIGENRGNVYSFAHSAIDAGADLVLGSGPHVVRGIEKYNDRLIVYSAGNFLTSKGLRGTCLLGKGAIFNITIDKNGLLKNLSMISTSSKVKNVVSEDLTNYALKKIIRLTEQDFGQILTNDHKGNIVFN